MNRSATTSRIGSAPRSRPAARVAARARPGGASSAWRSAALRVFAGAVLLVGIALVAPGLFLDTPQPAPRASDAIVVISGDEQMARFQEGVNLYQQGLGHYLVFSGAAYDNGISNAEAMRALAIQRGVSDRVILEESQGEDTWGNAAYTRQ